MTIFSQSDVQSCVQVFSEVEITLRQFEDGIFFKVFLMLSLSFISCHNVSSVPIKVFSYLQLVLSVKLHRCRVEFENSPTTAIKRNFYHLKSTNIMLICTVRAKGCTIFRGVCEFVFVWHAVGPVLQCPIFVLLCTVGLKAYLIFINFGTLSLYVSLYKLR